MQEPNGTNKIADWQLRQRQAMPLDLKVELSLRRIRDWCDHWDDMVYVAFSGGLDSTVLLHLARQVLPDCPAVFHDTGLEFPEIRDFVKTVDNVTWTKPRMTFKQVLETYGYPVVSKRVAQYVGEVQRAKGDTATKRLRTTGIKSNGEYTPLGKVPDKWQYLFDAPFSISDHCCKIFKKYPARDYEEKTGRHGMIGTRTEEGTQRELAYLEHGCNGYDLAVPRSTPLAFAFCMLGCHMEKGKNRFQVMEETHPRLHDYCINKLGLGEILQHIGVNPYNTQLELFDDDDDNGKKLTDN